MPTAAGAISSSPSPGDGSGRSTSSSRSAPWNSSARTAARSAQCARGDVDHLADAHELHPRATLRRPQPGLVRIDGLPALPGHEARTALGVELVRAVLDRRVQPPGLAVGEDPGHRVGRVLLVRADHARGAALDPAHDVLAALVLPGL